MSFRDNARYLRLCSQLALATAPTEQRRIAAEIHPLIGGLLERATQRRDRDTYASLSLSRARLARQVEVDPARALPDIGVALLISGSNPISHASMQRRYEAAGELALIYHLLADPLNATTAAVEGLLAGRPTAGQSLLDAARLCQYLLGSRNQGAHPYFESLVNITETALPEVGLPAPVIAPMQELARQRLGITNLDYWTAVAAWEQIVRIDGATAHRIELPVDVLLADAAVANGLDHLALSLVERRFGSQPGTAWLESPLFEIAAGCHLRAGRVEHALTAALRGHLVCLLGSLKTASTIGRGKISALGQPCRQIVMQLAISERDTTTLLDVLANEPVQARLGEHGGLDLPDWILDCSSPDSTLGFGTHTVFALVASDWDTPLFGQTIYATTGSPLKRELDLLQAHVGTPLPVMGPVEALDRCRTTEDIAWFTSVADTSLYWVTIDLATISLQGGIVDLDGTRAGDALVAFHRLHGSDNAPIRAVTDPVFLDPIRWLASPDSPEEHRLMTAAGELLPAPLRQWVGAADDRPRSLLVSLAPELTFIPWAVVRIGDLAQCRLVEAFELELIGPLSHLSTRVPAKLEGYELSLSCCNPDGTLRRATPVYGVTTLDGNRGPVDGTTFLEQLSTSSKSDGTDVLFVRGHLGSDGSTWLAPDRGLLFANGDVVSSRLLAKFAMGQPSLLAWPKRVVLAACMSSIADVDEGLSLGLCSTMKLLGASEVIASLFPVPDTRWSCEFDHHLAKLSVEPVTMSSGLRLAQLVALQEWQTAEPAQFGLEYEEGPHPLVWAAYIPLR